MQTVRLQEVLIETTDAGAAAVVRLKAELEDATAKVAAKDDEIDAIKRQHASELAAVVDHSLDVDALDEAVASRTAVIVAARAILGAEFDPSGKSDMAIRRLAAEKKLGEAKVRDKDDAYLAIVFDTLAAAMVNTDPAQTSTSAAIQPGYAIKAYTAQIAIHNKLDSATHGSTNIEHAIQLSFAWVQHALQGSPQQQSHF